MSGSRAFLPLVLFFLAMTFSCSDGGKVIPRKKMVSIYADMFVADQWLNQNYKAERVADTSFVYEAIFEKYGYDSDDYRASVDYYIQDPDRFARILRQTVLELEDRMDEQRAELRKLRASSGGGREVTYTFDFDRIWIFENGYPRVTVRDSLEYFRSRNEYFILDPKPLAEPQDYGMEVYFPQDTLTVTDTSQKDAPAEAGDSVIVADTLR
ncbi:MAG TPA: DUF4296 domain-containing protein [Candidatus Cryptobacteroides intestinipullorum]|nr:DUF4296 domain-containing protein [Candidatus Cryptobacteroides intestinipullorum]